MAFRTDGPMRLYCQEADRIASLYERRQGRILDYLFVHLEGRCPGLCRVRIAERLGRPEIDCRTGWVSYPAQDVLKGEDIGFSYIDGFRTLAGFRVGRRR